jgi:8-oxo-dGTP diphosphatase
MEPEHFVGKVSLRAIIEQDGKLFVCRGIEDKVWQLPGGRMHKGEAPKQALAREILEELGATVVVGRPTSAHYVVHTKTGIPQLVLVYACLLGAGELKVDPSETEEVRWVTHEEATKLPMFQDCRDAVDEFLKQGA